MVGPPSMYLLRFCSLTRVSLFRLKPHVEEMVARELKAREIARNQLSTSTPFIETFQTEDLPEEEYQCVSCKAYCYLAQVTCACTRDVGCLDHAAQLCGCDLSQKSLRLRFSDDALRDLEKQVSDRAGSPEGKIFPSPPCSDRSMNYLLT